MIHPIHVTSSQASTLICSFETIEDAITFCDRKGFDRGFDIQDTRPIDDPARLAEIPLHAAFIIRQSLLIHWTQMQFDRILAGEILRIPADPAMGLAVPTALYAEKALLACGSEGWTAVTGTYDDPSPYPTPLKHHTDLPLMHAWLQHEDGMIIDLSRRVFNRRPITVLDPDHDNTERFIAQRPIVSRRSDIVAADWFEASGPDVTASLVRIGADAMLKKPQPEGPEPAL